MWIVETRELTELDNTNKIYGTYTINKILVNLAQFHRIIGEILRRSKKIMSGGEKLKINIDVISDCIALRSENWTITKAVLFDGPTPKAKI